MQRKKLIRKESQTRLRKEVWKERNRERKGGGRAVGAGGLSERLVAWPEGEGW